jgi:hypothetical protein
MKQSEPYHENNSAIWSTEKLKDFFGLAKV